MMLVAKITAVSPHYYREYIVEARTETLRLRLVLRSDSMLDMRLLFGVRSPHDLCGLPCRVRTHGRGFIGIAPLLADKLTQIRCSDFLVDRIGAEDDEEMEADECGPD